MNATRGELPRWNCQSKKDQRLLEQWTNEQLDLLYEPTASDLQSELEVMNDDNYNNAVSKDSSDTWLRGRIIRAIRGHKASANERKLALAMGIEADEAPSFDVLIQLIGNDLQSSRFALRQLWQLVHSPPPKGKKNNRGRKRGESRPSDFSPLERDALSDAAQDMDRIRAIWKRRFGKMNRSERQPPTALEIAARRNGVDEDKLRSWRSNR
ncbi:hypothetical protein IVB36_05845 [Bradyrhizobium sp. 35]|uniref:hypothetical protein n=1 Tax=Bradyrhizobium sp. 35 TaxID=2782670 RepID=UPI001FF9A942|nr:hypothetical protein [Bradyrhizobium sp. 35]MCK1450440.1 hypothetical protein [Bradyrhizobium sp. 35]